MYQNSEKKSLFSSLYYISFFRATCTVAHPKVQTQSVFLQHSSVHVNKLKTPSFGLHESRSAEPNSVHIQTLVSLAKLTEF